VALISSGATPSKQEPRFWGSGTPWVSAKDMKSDPIVSSEDMVSDAALAETNLKLVPSNSILLVVRGMILAHTVPIRVNSVPVTINQDLKALRPKEIIHHQFLRWCLQCLHPYLLAKVSNAAHGTTKLDMEVVTNLKIPLPPLSLQQEFAERVAEVEGISALNDKASEAADQLAQSLMSQVFG
jgi:type I restriction enzyme S subunit